MTNSKIEIGPLRRGQIIRTVQIEDNKFADCASDDPDIRVGCGLVPCLDLAARSTPFLMRLPGNVGDFAGRLQRDQAEPHVVQGEPVLAVGSRGDGRLLFDDNLFGGIHAGSCPLELKGTRQKSSFFAARNVLSGRRSEPVSEVHRVEPFNPAGKNQDAA